MVLLVWGGMWRLDVYTFRCVYIVCIIKKGAVVVAVVGGGWQRFCRQVINVVHAGAPPNRYNKSVQMTLWLSQDNGVTPVTVTLHCRSWGCIIVVWCYGIWDAANRYFFCQNENLALCVYRLYTYIQYISNGHKMR